MNNKIYLVIAIIFFVLLGIAVGYIFGQKNSVYEGNTAQQWEKIYSDFLDVKCTKDDIKLFEDNANNLKPKKSISVNTFLKCEPGWTAYKEYLIVHPSPTIMPELIYKTQDTSRQSHGMNCQPVTGAWPSGQMNCTSY
jgi:hypothetical protein